MFDQTGPPHTHNQDDLNYTIGIYERMKIKFMFIIGLSYNKTKESKTFEEFMFV